MRHILLIISGSIAAIKTPDLIRKLRSRDIAVRAILTHGGEQFVSRKDVQAAGATLYTELFSSDEDIAMAHIHLSRESDLVVVAPASANMMAKMVHGFADDLASATLLASNKKILVAPAMNTQMWNHPATQRNIKQLVKDGAEIIEPGEGMLACGEEGPGRMAEPEEILKGDSVVIARSEGDETICLLDCTRSLHFAMTALQSRHYLAARRMERDRPGAFSRQSFVGQSRDTCRLPRRWRRRVRR